MYVYGIILQCCDRLLFAVDVGDEQFLCTRCDPFLFRNDGSITPKPFGLHLLDLTDMFIVLLLQYSAPIWYTRKQPLGNRIERPVMFSVFIFNF